MSLISKQHKVTNQSPYLYHVQPSERRSTTIRFMQIRQSSQSSKNQTNSGNSRKFIRNTTQDRVNPEKVPFRYNVCWCRVRICRNIIIWMPQKLRVKINQISSSKTLSQSSYQIFCVKVRIKVDQISLSINSQWICGSILMQCSKVNQTQPPLQKRKQIMETIKTIQSRIINTKSTPLPTNNTCSNNRQSTCQTCNNSSSPKRHLTPGLYITNKSSQNHNQQNYNSKQPYKFTRLCITCIVQTTKKMHINNNKKQTSSVCMQITQLPTIRYITHQVLYTMKCLINMSSIVHCQKDTSPNLQNKTQSSQNTPIIISIQIRRCWITNQMILRYNQQWLIPQTTTQFFDRSFH
eukprot:GHRQ01000044.1.p1 GENE.GHRQ01000044.1~~GHRQ01000044.1.p1  ORF type:complete len:350 (-),score=-61.41 GHRQ01000044.1:128-1177(-)